MAAKTEETGFELLARLGSRVPLLGIAPHLFEDGPHPGDMYEFFGEDGSGKTEILLNLIVTCTLPDAWKCIPMKGAKAKVILISTDYKFSILRLVFIMEQKVRKILMDSNPNGDSSDPGETTPSSSTCQKKNLINSDSLETEVETLVQECLQRLQVVYCNSSQQLFITLCYLESQFVTDPDYSLLIIDPISTFYWIDKFISNENASQQGANIQRVTEILKKFVQNFGIITIATKSGIFKSKLTFPESNSSGSMPFLRRKPHFQYLDSIWENFITKRFIFLKDLTSALPSSGPQFIIQQPKGRSVKFIITENGVEFL